VLAAAQIRTTKHKHSKCTVSLPVAGLRAFFYLQLRAIASDALPLAQQVAKAAVKGHDTVACR
jgi:hypothetical protein